MFCVIKKENDDSLLECTQIFFLSFLKKIKLLLRRDFLISQPQRIYKYFRDKV